MVVVIPFCAKDEQLCLKNLETAIALDGHVDFNVVVSHVIGIDPGPVIKLALQYFGKVSDFQYPPCKGSQNFPRPNNWAWQNTVRQMVRQNEPWLWWEPDAVPLRAGWLKVLADEYRAGAKAFMGNWVMDNPHWKTPYMNGLAVYPNNFLEYPTPALRMDNPSWDVILGPFIEARTHKVNHLIQHSIEPVSFVNIHQVHQMRGKETVLFHKCKDGTLHQLVRENSSSFRCLCNAITDIIPDNKNPLKIFKNLVTRSSPITVVITNFKRPTLVWRAFDSCVKAGVQNIVVSASGADGSLEKVHDRMRQAMPTIRINSTREDYGCNEMWLRGVKMVDTPWVHILHDDDIILPQFSEIETHITRDIGCIFWCGELRTLDNTSKEILNYLNIPEGIYGTDILLQTITNKVSKAISPVLGLFRTKDVVDILQECSEIESGFLLRDKMMIGNDVLIWMRITERYKTFYWIPKPLVSLGVWRGSTTFDDRSNNKNLLLPIYNKIRKYFSTHPRTKPITAFHSGDIGDIIYSLLFLKTFGNVVLYLGNDPKTKVRNIMNSQLFDFLSPLLNSQTWLKSSYVDHVPKVDYNLNKFRELWFSPKRTCNRLFEAYPKYFKYPALKEDMPWMNVEPIYDYDNPVIVSRSPRYQNPLFPWKQIYDKYRTRMRFVGLKEEYDDWVNKYGNQIIYTPVKDALEMARIIAGSKLFIGNQSFPMSLALSLNIPIVQEVFNSSPDCIFNRSNVIYFKDNPIDFPDVIRTVKPPILPSIELGPCDRAHGLGDMISIIPLAANLPNCVMCLPPRLVKYAFLFDGICSVKITEDHPIFLYETGMNAAQYKLNIFGLKNISPIPRIHIKPIPCDEPTIVFVPTCKPVWQTIRSKPPEFWEPYIKIISQKYKVMQFGLPDYPLIPGAIRAPWIGLQDLAKVYAGVGKYFGVDTGDYHLMIAVGGRALVVQSESVHGYDRSVWSYPQTQYIKYTSFSQPKDIIQKVKEFINE